MCSVQFHVRRTMWPALSAKQFCTFLLWKRVEKENSSVWRRAPESSPSIRMTDSVRIKWLLFIAFLPLFFASLLPPKLSSYTAQKSHFTLVLFCAIAPLHSIFNDLAKILVKPQHYVRSLTKFMQTVCILCVCYFQNAQLCVLLHACAKRMKRRVTHSWLNSVCVPLYLSLSLSLYKTLVTPGQERHSNVESARLGRRETSFPVYTHARQPPDAHTHARRNIGGVREKMC